MIVTFTLLVVSLVWMFIGPILGPDPYDVAPYDFCELLLINGPILLLYGLIACIVYVVIHLVCDAAKYRQEACGWCRD